MASEFLVELNDQNWEEQVVKSDVPVLVDFWAIWCAPCRMIAPAVEELAAEYSGKFKVGKLDVDHNQGTAIKYGIRSIPTLILFKDGVAADSVIGVVPKDILKKKMDELIG